MVEECIGAPACLSLLFCGTTIIIIAQCTHPLAVIGEFFHVTNVVIFVEIFLPLNVIPFYLTCVSCII